MNVDVSYSYNIKKSMGIKKGPELLGAFLFRDGLIIF